MTIKMIIICNTVYSPPVFAMLKSSQINALPAFHSESESLAPLLMLQVLQRLDFTRFPDWTIASRVKSSGIDPCFLPLLTRWHHLLYEEGLLEPQQEGWRLGGCAPCEMALEQRVDDARHRLRHFLNGEGPAALFPGGLLADGSFASSDELAAVLKKPQMASTLLCSHLKPGTALVLFEPASDRLLSWVSAVFMLYFAANGTQEYPTEKEVPDGQWRQCLTNVGLEVIAIEADASVERRFSAPRAFLARLPA